MEKHMWGRLKDFVLQDVKNENEIKMYAVILRMGLLVMFLYYGITMTGAVMMSRPASLIAAGVGVLLSAVLFGSTYHNRTKAAAFFFILSFSVLILVSVLMYGNYTGVFHFMYVQIVLLYALDYMPFAGKAASTVLLVAFRIGLFHYVERVGTFYIIDNDELSLRQGLHIVVTCLLLLVIVSASTQDFREMQEKLVSYNRKLQNIASIDPLTGLRNRRSGMEYIREQAEGYCNGETKALTIAIGDIDFFKKINDTYGHNYGDLVLKTLADAFKNFMKSRGRVARWGGEEFLFIFHNINGDEASYMLADLQNEIHQMEFRMGGDTVRLTMTFGVAEYDLRREADDTINEADQKLYMGKAQGRDRIVY